MRLVMLLSDEAFFMYTACYFIRQRLSVIRVANYKLTVYSYYC